MKLEVNKAWCLAAARREGDAEVGAGIVAFDPEPSVKSEARAEEASVETTQIAFGRVVHLLRRQRSMNMEKVAQNARVELSELVAIENDPHFRPEPRTVSQLAHLFGVDAKAFQQLAGNAVIRDTRVREEAALFAARAGSIEKLTREESTALEQFISVLSDLTDNSGKPRP